MKEALCGMGVDEQKAAATAQQVGRTAYFWSTDCKQTFEREPQRFDASDRVSG